MAGWIVLVFILSSLAGFIIGMVCDDYDKGQNDDWR